MSIEDGHRMFADRSKPTEPAATSALARGALAYRASRGDRQARTELTKPTKTEPNGEPT